MTAAPRGVASVRPRERTPLSTDRAEALGQRRGDRQAVGEIGDGSAGRRRASAGPAAGRARRARQRWRAPQRARRPRCRPLRHPRRWPARRRRRRAPRPASRAARVGRLVLELGELLLPALRARRGCRRARPRGTGGRRSSRRPSASSADSAAVRAADHRHGRIEQRRDPHHLVDRAVVGEGQQRRPPAHRRQAGEQRGERALLLARAAARPAPPGPAIEPQLRRRLR